MRLMKLRSRQYSPGKVVCKINQLEQSTSTLSIANGFHYLSNEMIDERVLKKNCLHLTDDATQISTDNFSKYSSIFLGIDIYNTVHS